MANPVRELFNTVKSLDPEQVERCIDAWFALDENAQYQNSRVIIVNAVNDRLDDARDAAQREKTARAEGKAEGTAATYVLYVLQRQRIMAKTTSRTCRTCRVWEQTHLSDFGH